MNKVFCFLLVFSICGMLSAARPLVVQVDVDDVIASVTNDYIKDAYKYAEKEGATALLIQVDTPGGLLSATRDIVQAMLNAKLPTLVYIGPSGARAGSAGVFLALAANKVAMAPSTNIGAAHPVSAVGGDIEGELGKKIENDTVAWARTLAEGKKRNANWAEKAVRESVSISANQALKEKVIDLIAKNKAEYLQSIDGMKVVVDGKTLTLKTKDAVIRAFPMSGSQKILKALSDPNVLFFLLLLGVFALFIEFQVPGLSLPGLFGALCLFLVFGTQLLPVNWLAVVMILGAAVLFVAEIYIVSFGLLSLLGLALFVTGSFMLFDVPGSNIQVDAAMIWSFSILMFLLCILIGFLIVKAKAQGATSGIDAMSGKVVNVTKAIGRNDFGTIYYGGTYWQASADKEIQANTRVRIKKMKGAVAFVEEIKE